MMHDVLFRAIHLVKNRKSKKEPPRQEPELECGGLAVQYRDFDNT